MQFVAFDVGDDFVVEADLVQVAAAVIQIVDLSAVGQDGGGAVAVEVVVVADGFGNGQVQHIVLRIAPVGFGQAVSGVLFFARHLPLGRAMSRPFSFWPGQVRMTHKERSSENFHTTLLGCWVLIQTTVTIVCLKNFK